jgi:hypothetical protein
MAFIDWLARSRVMGLGTCGTVYRNTDIGANKTNNAGSPTERAGMTIRNFLPCRHIELQREKRVW